MSGNINFSTSLANAGLDSPANCENSSCFAPVSSFNCSLSYRDAFQAPGLDLHNLRPVSVLCLPNGQFIQGQDGTPEMNDTPLSDTSMPYLVFKTNATASEWNETLGSSNEVQFDFIQFASSVSISEEWVIYSLPTGSWARMSLCFQQLEVDSCDVELSTPKVLTIPDPIWLGNAGWWNTATIENQLGISSPSSTASQRGLFSLDSIGSYNATDPAAAVLAVFLTPVSGDGYNESFSVSNSGTGYIQDMVGSRLQSVYDNILTATNRPALALQSLFTAMVGATLENILPTFDEARNVTTVSLVEALVPVTTRGLLIVTGITVVAILSSTATTCLYLMNTHYSRVGDHWCAVAQIVTEETEEALHGAVLGFDESAKRLLRAQGGDAQMRIGRHPSGDGVGLLRVGRENEKRVGQVGVGY